MLASVKYQTEKAKPTRKKKELEMRFQSSIVGAMESRPYRAQPAGQPAARQLQGSIQKSEPRFATLISPLLIVN